MGKPSQSGYKRFFYNQNIKRAKSGKKYKNLCDHCVLLMKRVEKDGLTSWLNNAILFAKNKLERYGVASYQMISLLRNKGLSDLEKHMALFYV